MACWNIHPPSTHRGAWIGVAAGDLHVRRSTATVFRKTRSAEIAEVARALRAQEICESTHGIAHEVFDREVT